ncbi:MAG: hypothetical protein JWQ54_4227 [Mucilaginibacter sp.]|nr:hypothetical protein [Mucilaginibacter sp.]
MITDEELRKIELKRNNAQEVPQEASIERRTVS